jgi:hypothetical protein
METVARAATKDAATLPSRRLPGQANGDPQRYPENAARLFALNHRAPYFTLPPVPVDAQKDSDWGVKYDEPVKSRNPDGFEKSSSYGAQISAA